MWRASTGQWYVLSGANPGVVLVNGVAWGEYGDCAVPGRLAASGPGDLNLNVWRPSTGRWYYGRSLAGSGGESLSWGVYGDIPFVMDFDGDGDGDIAVWRPSTGVWYGMAPVFTVLWGAPGDIPVPQGYQGSTSSILFVWRPSTGTRYDCHAPSGSSCGSTTASPAGAPGYVPLAGRSK